MDLALPWKMLVLRGALGLVFGIVAMVWPVETVLALVILWGIWALVDGIAAIVAAFGGGLGAWGRIGYLALGALSLLAAFFALFRPVGTAVVLTWILGIWLVIRGIFEIVAAFTEQSDLPKWLEILGAILLIVAGIIFMANPGTAAVAATFWLGFLAALWGLAFVIAGIIFWRKASKTPATA